MSHGKGPTNVDIIANVLGQLLEIIMSCLKPHGPVSHQWTKPTVMIDYIPFMCKYT